MIRSFNWRDFPRLHSYRDQGIWLDSELLLTQRPVLVPVGALLAYLAPATGVYTYVAFSEDTRSAPVIGQFSYWSGMSIARLSFLAPQSAIATKTTQQLLDLMVEQAGKKGVQHLIAEIDELSETFEVLRRAGFAIFSRQKIWRMPEKIAIPPESTPWKSVSPLDEAAIRNLYSALVPSLAQQVEAPPWERLQGFVLYEAQDLLAYIHLFIGPRGILAQPFIHPDSKHLGAKLVDLLNKIPNRNHKPFYVMVRSHQGWLEILLQQMGAQTGPTQAVMVKRLAITQKVEATLKIPTASLDKARPETSSIHLRELPEEPVFIETRAKSSHK